MLLVGRLSYSTYIFHAVVLNCVGYCMVRYFQAGLTSAQALTIMLIVGSVMTFLASMIMHKFVEKPGIEFGRWLRARRASANTAKKL